MRWKFVADGSKLKNHTADYFLKLEKNKVFALASIKNILKRSKGIWFTKAFEKTWQKVN